MKIFKSFKIKKKDKRNIYILFVIFMALLSISGILIWFNIIEPSKMSVESACAYARETNTTNVDIYRFYNKNFTTQEKQKIIEQYLIYLNESEGNTLAFFDATTKEIVYIGEGEPSEETIKHEKCHERQYYEGRLVNCENYKQKFMNEIECNIRQYI